MAHLLRHPSAALLGRLPVGVLLGRSLQGGAGKDQAGQDEARRPGEAQAAPEPHPALHGTPGHAEPQHGASWRWLGTGGRHSSTPHLHLRLSAALLLLLHHHLLTLLASLPRLPPPPAPRCQATAAPPADPAFRAEQRKSKQESVGLRRSGRTLRAPALQAGEPSRGAQQAPGPAPVAQRRRSPRHASSCPASSGPGASRRAQLEAGC